MGKKEKRPYVAYNLYTFTNVCKEKKKEIYQNTVAVWLGGIISDSFIFFLFCVFQIFCDKHAFFHKLSEKSHYI